MGMTFKKNIAVFGDAVGVESAEEFLTWMRKHPKAKVDLTTCTHLHAAQLQILMALKIPVAAWPDDETLKCWLTTALSS